MYNFSTDYERLYQLMQEEKDPVCVKGKYLFQFIQDDLEMYFDKESFITYCKDFNLRFIDPQPVDFEEIRIQQVEKKFFREQGFAAGQASIIEQLKGLQAFTYRGNTKMIGFSDIESIINQSK